MGHAPNSIHAHLRSHSFVQTRPVRNRRSHAYVPLSDFAGMFTAIARALGHAVRDADASDGTVAEERQPRDEMALLTLECFRLSISMRSHAPVSRAHDHARTQRRTAGHRQAPTRVHRGVRPPQVPRRAAP